MRKDFAFLKSVRFWKLGVVSVCWGLWQAGVLPTEVFSAVALWLLGSTSIRTVDRLGEKIKELED